MPLELKVLFIVLTILCACSAIALLIGVIAKKQELCLKVIKAIKAKVGVFVTVYIISHWLNPRT